MNANIHAFMGQSQMNLLDAKITRIELARLVAATMVGPGGQPPVKYINNQIDHLVRRGVLLPANKPRAGQSLYFSPFECALYMIAAYTGITSTIALDELLNCCRQTWVEGVILDCATLRQSKEDQPHLALTRTYIGEDADPGAKGIREPIAYFHGHIIEDIGAKKEWLRQEKDTAVYLGTKHANLINLHALLQPLRAFLEVED